MIKLIIFLFVVVAVFLSMSISIIEPIPMHKNEPIRGVRFNTQRHERIFDKRTGAILYDAVGVT